MAKKKKATNGGTPRSVLKSGIEKDPRGRPRRLSIPHQFEQMQVIRGVCRTLHFIKNKSTPVASFIIDNTGITWRKARVKKAKPKQGESVEGQPGEADKPAKPETDNTKSLFVNKRTTFDLTAWEVNGQDGPGRHSDQPSSVRLLPNLIYDLKIIGPDKQHLGTLQVMIEGLKYVKPNVDESDITFTTWDQLPNALNAAKQYSLN